MATGSTSLFSPESTQFSVDYVEYSFLLIRAGARFSLVDDSYPEGGRLFSVGNSQSFFLPGDRQAEYQGLQSVTLTTSSLTLKDKWGLSPFTSEAFKGPSDVCKGWDSGGRLTALTG